MTPSAEVTAGGSAGAGLADTTSRLAGPWPEGGRRSAGHRAPTADGLHRPRLAVALDRLWARRVCLVAAPPGSGKTTLLAGWSRRCGQPVAWYSAEAGDASRAAVLAQIYTCMADALAVAGPWRSVDQAVLALECLGRQPVLLVVDDLHNLAGTEAESVIAELVSCLPPTVRVLAATRATPSLKLSRLRLDEEIIELGAEDLRFRAWETASLFREHYGYRLRPEEVSLLTARTGGWAAGLQLFHLATRDKSPAERARVLGDFSARSRLVADYLADNVMADLPGDLVEFMVRTCALGVLTAGLCDQLLGRSDGSSMLAELERRQLFVTSADDGCTYRYHEILRSYLDGRLVAELGEAEARQWHYRAGRLLRAERFSEAALRALCRAGAWEEVATLRVRLGEGGLVGGLTRTSDAAAGAAGMGAIPSRLVELDPWIGLAQARGHVAAGHLEAAVAAYRRCEEGLSRQAAQTCRAEMVAVAAWANPIPSPAPGWTNDLRRALARDPVRALGSTGGAPDGEASTRAGLGALLAGQVARAALVLAEAALQVTSPGLGLAVRLGEVLASLLGAHDPTAASEGARRALAIAGEAERLGVPWLARQAYAMLALAGEPDIAVQVSAQCRCESDAWGEVLAQLFEGAGRLRLGEAPLEPLSAAASGARSIGAGVLEAWALACLALAEARAGNPQARELGLAAEATARRAAVPGAQAIAHLALGQAGLGQRVPDPPALGHAHPDQVVPDQVVPDQAPALDQGALPEQAPRQRGRPEVRAIEHLRLGRALGEECGLGVLRSRPAPVAPESSRNVSQADGGAGLASPPGVPVAPLSNAEPISGEVRSGACLSQHAETPQGAPRPEGAGLELRCFGGLAASRDATMIRLDALRPRARALLAILALRFPLPVHCEVLSEALWPDTDPRAGAHRLQTAISSLRRVLAPPDARRVAPNPLVRRGEAYLLVAEGVDFADFALDLQAARRARRAKDTTAEVTALSRLLAGHQAELLPEFGPAEWVLKDRDRLRWDTVEAAERLAGLELAAGHPSEALSAARAGLALDHYRESLWRLAVRAAEATRDHCLAATLRSARAGALAELGIAG